MKKKTVKTVAFILVAVLIITSFSFVFFLPSAFGSSGYVYGAVTAAEDKHNRERLELLKLYIEYIHENYKDEVDYDVLIDGAFEGVVNVLGDPYSEYYTIQEAEAFLEEVEGNFSGIGVQLEMADGKLRVVAPLRNTPAERAGIKAGDVITEIDGVAVEGKTLSEAAQSLRGPSGSQVTVVIERDSQTFSLTMTRELVQTASVTYSLGEDKIGYIQISSFTLETNAEFVEARLALVNNGAEGIVLDLRNNPGGYMDQALNVGAQILNGGVLTHYESQEEIIETVQDGNIACIELPMVVLVNEGTASAAEMLAGSLQDHGTPVVGMTTYGKGVAQTLVEVGDDKELKLSILYFITPDQNTINGKGVTPDHIVRQTIMSDEEIAAFLLSYAVCAPMNEEKKPAAGDTGLNVYGAQQRLMLLGYDVEANGIMDEKTVKAVKDFQREAGLYAYGVLDYTTRDTLDALCYNIASGSFATEDMQMQKAVEVLQSMM